MLLKSLKNSLKKRNLKIKIRHFLWILNLFKPSFLRVDVLEKKMNLSIHTYSKKFKRVCTLLQVYCWNASRISVSHFHCLDILSVQGWWWKPWQWLYRKKSLFLHIRKLVQTNWKSGLTWILSYLLSHESWNPENSIFG